MSEDKKKELKMDELESVSGGYEIYHNHDPEGNLIEIGSWNKPFEEKDL